LDSYDDSITIDAPDVECTCGGLMTYDGKILWTRNSDEKVPIGSTTKIMTALVALENGSLTDKITVSENAASTEGSTANLTEGDVLTLNDMLYAMMLPSGNDAAVAIAEYYGNGDVDNFVKLMNQKASELGMTSTHYSSSNGLEDEDNYSTVTDFFKLVPVAMSNDTFAKIVATESFTYTSTSTGNQVTVENTNEILSTYDGMTGIKTGFTDSAGYCFVGAAERDGIGFYTVVLGDASDWDRFNDTETLLDWGFTHYHKVTLLSSDTQVGSAVATDWLDKTVPVAASNDVKAVVFDYDPDLQQTTTINDRGGAIEKGADMGTVVWTDENGNQVAEAQLVATESVDPPSLFQTLQIWWCRFTTLFTGDDFSVTQSVDLPSVYKLLSSNTSS
ncbi:MAG: D-alanyl-D-alanine carboxypeptidase family protein, partial [Coriobacteriales bacterium]